MIIAWVSTTIEKIFTSRNLVKTQNFPTTVTRRDKWGFVDDKPGVVRSKVFILKRMERSCWTTSPVQNGGRRLGHGGKGKDWLTFSCNPALLRLLTAPLGQESFWEWTINKSNDWVTRKRLKFYSIKHLPFSFSRSLRRRLTRPSSNAEGPSPHCHCK